MTLTTLSSKEFKPLFKWAFKRNRAIMIIFSVLMGLGLILNIYFMSFDFYDEDAVLVTLSFFEVGAAFFTFVSALKTFSFLHNKRSVDMFGSLPTNRTTMFVSHLLAGITAISLPFTIGSIIIMGLASRSSETFNLGVFMILTTLLMIVAAYTFTALIAYCCGTVIDTAIVTIASNGIWVGMIGIYFGFLSSIIPGCTFESIVDSPVLSALAPYSFSVFDVLYYEESNLTALITIIAWQLIFTVGIFLLSIFVSNKRKAESSQNGFAFNWLPMVIKAGVSIVAGAFIGFIISETAYSGYTNMYIFAFWYIIFGFVAFFILHIIFARGVKGKFIPQAIVFASTTAAALIIVFSMSYGMGIDTYVPNPNTIKSVEFGYYKYTEPENIKIVTEIHKLITDGIQDAEGYPYFLGEDTIYSEYNDDYAHYDYITSSIFNIHYNRKIGFPVYRQYYLGAYKSADNYFKLSKINNLLQQLYASEEFKKSLFPEIFDEDIRNDIKINSASISYDDDYSYSTAVDIPTESYDDDYSYSTAVDIPTDNNFINGFYEAFKTDIMADDSFYAHSKSSDNKYAEISIQYTRTGKHTNAYTNEYTSEFTYNIKNSYKTVLDYLEKNNIEKPSLLDSNYSTKMYYKSYSDFGRSGSYYDLRLFVNDIAPSWEYRSCGNAGIDDYSQWHKDNYESYWTAITQKSEDLFYKYCDDEKYKDPNYTNDYIEETDAFGEYFQLEDKIIDELIKYSDEYVADTLTKDDADTSKNTGSDTDSNTQSKSETSSNTDTDSNTEIKTENNSTVSTL